MLYLVLTLAAVAVALVALFWTGTLLAQSYFYDTPAEGLHWRAPAAGGALLAFFAFWCLIEYANPGTTDAVHNFSHQQIRDVDRFVSVRRTTEGDKEIPYERRRTGATPVFVDRDGKQWSRSSSGAMVAIIIEEGDGANKSRRRFNADLDAQGRFVTQTTRGVNVDVLHYREEGGNAVILESNPGKIVQPRGGRLFLNIVLNLLHLAFWFLALWLLMRFQWSHALGFALVCWLAFTLVLVPFLMSRCRTAAERQSRPPPASQAWIKESRVSIAA